MSVAHLSKVLVVSGQSRWRDRAMRVLQNHLSVRNTAVECVDSVDEAISAVRQDFGIKCLLIRDNRDDRGVLSAIARMMTARPELRFVFLADDSDSGMMSKLLHLGQREDSDSAVTFAPNSYDYGQLCGLIDGISGR